MKSIAMTIMLLPLTGCLMEVMTTTAIEGDLAAQNASAATRALEKAKETANGVSARNEALMPAQGAGITAADRANKQKIQNAINRYGQATGYYPPTLQTLVQFGYLDALPKTSSGQDFLFNAQTGALNHPLELAAQTSAQPQASRRGTPSGGVGVMGETMTGLAVQNQLNSMNNSGVSNVGSAARAGARGTTGNYSDRQMQTLKDLDLDR